MEEKEFHELEKDDVTAMTSRIIRGITNWTHEPEYSVDTVGSVRTMTPTRSYPTPLGRQFSRPLLA